MELSIKEIKERQFEEKLIWFRNKLGRRKVSWTQGSDYIQIEKNNIMQDSLQFMDKCDFLKEIKIKFVNEQVTDAGGLIREWINLIVDELFSGKEEVFKRNREGFYFLKENRELEENKIQKIRLAGKVLGKSIMERITVNVGLNEVLIKHILGLDLVLEDLIAYDQEIYHNLQFVLNNQVEQIYFTVTSNNQEVELIPGGTHIVVNQSNRLLFAQKMMEFYLNKNIEVELNIFLFEFYEIIPKIYIEIFNTFEFSMLLNGIDQINIDDWKSNTDYKGNYNEKHKIIKQFWKVVEDELSNDQRQKLIQFSTGLKRIPVEGFKYLESNRGEICKFNIQDSKQLKAMTCFNRLYIPQYQDYQTLKINIIQICSSDFEGIFGLKE